MSSPSSGKCIWYRHRWTGYRTLEGVPWFTTRDPVRMEWRRRRVEVNETYNQDVSSPRHLLIMIGECDTYARVTLTNHHEFVVAFNVPHKSRCHSLHLAGVASAFPNRTRSSLTLQRSRPSPRAVPNVSLNGLANRR